MFVILKCTSYLSTPWIYLGHHTIFNKFSCLFSSPRHAPNKVWTEVRKLLIPEYPLLHWPTFINNQFSCKFSVIDFFQWRGCNRKIPMICDCLIYVLTAKTALFSSLCWWTRKLSKMSSSPATPHICECLYFPSLWGPSLWGLKPLR